MLCPRCGAKLWIEGDDLVCMYGCTRVLPECLRGPTDDPYTMARYKMVTQEMIDGMKRLRSQGKLLKQIAREYHCSTSQVSLMTTGKRTA